MIKSNNFFNELNLTHAIILSLIIHALFVMKLEISNSNLTPKPVVDIIFNTEIVKQVAPKVIPIVKPKPIIKPKSIPKPQPIIKPKPIPKPIPQPIVEPISEPIEEPIIEPIEPIVEPISESVEVTESAQINEQIPTSPNPQVVI